MGFRIRSILLFLFIQISWLSFSQDYFANIRTIGVKEGLSNHKVLDIYPEKDKIWIGTDDGLNRFDGYHWKYWTKDKGKLRARAVHLIHKDQNDFLWLFNFDLIKKQKHYQSIDILNTRTDSVYALNEYFTHPIPFKPEDIKEVFEDQQHRLFFYANNQLWQYTPNESFQTITLPEGFIPKTIFPNGHFVGKLKNTLVLVSSQDQSITHLNLPVSKGNYEIKGTSEKFWYLEEEFLYQVEAHQPGIYHESLFPLQPKKDIQTSILGYNKEAEHLWITNKKKTYLFDSKTNKLLYQYPGFRKIAKTDAHGNLWSGSSDITVFNPQKKKFNRYLYKNQDNTLPYQNYHCRGLIEADGHLIVNTYKGIRKIDLTDRTVEAISYNIPRVWAILKDSKQDLWLGSKKLSTYNPSFTQELATYDFEENKKKAWSVFEDQENRIWLGEVGLLYLENDSIKTFNQYNEFEELKDGLVLFFYKDKNGQIWVGSNLGLFQLDPKEGIIAAYGVDRKGDYYLPSNKFQHMYQDDQGVFWLATEDAGLIRWDKASGNISQFDKTNGMLSDNIYAIYEDEYNALWMSSFEGIIRFQKDTENCIVYTEKDGISGNEFNRISHYRNKEGYIYFGGQNGVTGFHPKDFQLNKTDAEKFELNITHISIFGRKILKDTFENGRLIDLQNLGPGVRVVDLEIGNSNIFWTDEVDLHYQLQKLNQSGDIVDSSRRKISSDNHVELFGLTPGIYTLQITAFLKNGKQFGIPLNIPLKIAVPISHTPGFWIGVICLLGLGIWAYIKYRTAQLKNRQIELEELVTERTEQILQDQKTILTQAEQIEVMKNQLNRKDELWLEQFQTIINEKITDADLYLPSIIDDMDISRSVFYEKVKSLTKMTPNQYIQELRLTKAKAILDEGNVKTVKEVAFAIGMKRPSYFSKLFKERFGVLPSAYFRDNSN